MNSKESIDSSGRPQSRQSINQLSDGSSSSTHSKRSNNSASASSITRGPKPTTGKKPPNSYDNNTKKLPPKITLVANDSISTTTTTADTQLTNNFRSPTPASTNISGNNGNFSPKLPPKEMAKKPHNTDSEISNPALSVTSSQYLHPFFSLPEPVRVKIFKYLTPTERLLAQFVCRRFRNDVRLRAGLRTKVTEETVTGIAFLRDVLVTSIIIGKYDRPVSAPSKLIYNPENIFELIFEEPICVQHLDAFLNRCRKIKWIIIRTTVVDTAVFPPNVKSPFNSFEWRSLEVIHKYPIPQTFLKELILCIPGAHCLRTVNRSLALLNTPSLERFSLVVNHPIAFEETTAVHFAVLNFLKNCLSVSHVIICTEQRPSTVRYASRSGNVQVLQVLHMTIWPLLRDIIMINAKTLVKVALHAILWDKNGRHSPIDLNVFGRSMNLKELYICIASAADVTTTKESRGHIDLLNFSKLPKNLEIVALKHAAVNMKDFLFIKNLNYLKSLGIVSLGTKESNSVGVIVLRKLVHIRSLEELFVSGLVAEGKEGEEMKNILNKMKARVRDKRRIKNTFHSYIGHGNRWSVNRNGSIVFTIFSNWGFMTY
ncbi:unnamed protein product [Allacma fusca]|uniref:F-box domain-containing protein n=1 Tax=Allacma fusca TaxID=39272 RepID=A0A8J2NM25_9HEXA|nr:unnamed protein product [Allacma fusca]